MYHSSICFLTSNFFFFFFCCFYLFLLGSMVKKQNYCYFSEVSGKKNKKTKKGIGIQSAVIIGSHFFQFIVIASCCYFSYYWHILHVPAARTTFFQIHPLKQTLTLHTEDNFSLCSATRTYFSTHQPLFQLFITFLCYEPVRKISNFPQGLFSLSSFSNRTPWVFACTQQLI